MTNEQEAGAPPATELPIDKLIDKYVQLRDRKEALKKAFDASTEAIDRAMEKVENVLLDHLNKVGGDSIKTSAGTAFKKTKISVATADAAEFFNFCMNKNEWALADVRPSKTAVVQYREAHNDLPPGVKWTELVEVQIRRA